MINNCKDKMTPWVRIIPKQVRPLFGWNVRVHGTLSSSFGGGERFFVAVMLFLDVAKAYAMRTNMSIAILAVVNHTYANGKNYTEVGVQDGQFKWTKIPVSAREGGVAGLCVVRFIQGLGEGPIVPCIHAMLAQLIPPSEKSRGCGFVYAGAQFGTIIAMPLSGILAEYGFDGGWPLIFYVFGAIEAIWCVNLLQQASPTVPYIAIWSSLPFYAIVFAHVGQNYIYETLMTEMPTYMKDVLGFSLKENAWKSAIPYLAMLICSIIISIIADKMDSSKKLTPTTTRKIINSIGQHSPAICLVAASYTGYSAAVIVTFLSIGLGLNGAVFSGFKANHLLQYFCFGCSCQRWDEPDNVDHDIITPTTSV